MAKKKDPAAVALGRKGGARKVPKGLAMLTDKQKTEIAKLGAQKSAEVRRAKKAAKKKG